jgi:hypothetical protein
MSTLTKLIAYWRMDESSGNRLDSVGALDLEPLGTVNHTTGKLGDGAVALPSAATWLAAVGTVPADFSAATMTLAGWLRIDTASGTSTRAFLQFKVHNGSGGNIRELMLSINNNTGELELNTRDVDTDTDETVVASTFGALSTGTWYHVVIVWDGNDARLLVNGTEDSGSAKSMFGSLTIQSHVFGYSTGSDHEISLDDWGLWNEEISATDISDLYNSGTGAVPPGLGYPAGSGNQSAFFGFHGF